jgi:hypothetical protein
MRRTVNRTGNFVCKNCRKEVSLNAPGTKNRNHCPFCLFSLHVDNRIGDRGSGCQGLMEPIGKQIKKDGEEVLVHKCLVCNEIRRNRVAGDDNVNKVDSLPVLL